MTVPDRPALPELELVPEATPATADLVCCVRVAERPMTNVLSRYGPVRQDGAEATQPESAPCPRCTRQCPTAEEIADAGHGT
jgi:hypothetical protein